MRDFDEIHGVDFSGAAHAGRNIWVARTQAKGKRLLLRELQPLESHAGVSDRDGALAHLVAMIRGSQRSAWGMDFPFGLPVELHAMGESWPEQMRFIASFAGDARSFGLWCVGESKRSVGRLHVRRTTDSEVKTPFDCYHYRIVHQTFHGMRDVLAELTRTPATAILPFQYDRLARADRVIVEACPSSTLKRLGLPHQNYKEPAAKTVSAPKRRTRRAILAGLEEFIEIPAAQRKAIYANPGGDALDAVIAAVGVWQSLGSVDHDAIQRHPRYTREGFVYA